MIITFATFRNIQFLLTLWGDFSKIEGPELHAKIEREEYPIILGRNIGISSYQDATGSTIALISGALGEKILSMTAEDIFDTTCVKLQLLCLDYIHQMLSNKLFNIQLKKSSWVSANVTSTSLTIVLVTENEQVLPLTIDQRIAKKVRPLATSEQEMEPRIVESGSSSATLALEPLMPAKITKSAIALCHWKLTTRNWADGVMGHYSGKPLDAILATSGIRQHRGDPLEMDKREIDMLRNAP
ncbi:hypothetical protein BC332_30579 [Capsicum chinense]|nr:hypothetical protein BC332_30579 [Capsicum chinense]